MAHFSEETWVDYARGMGLKKAELESHLATGCRECVADLNLWHGANRLASAEAAFEPPKDLVRMVKLEFVCQQPVQEDSSIARLIFDSSAQPLAVGVRSGVTSTRQFVYEAEGLTVDLRLEDRPDSALISASGQVLDRQQPSVQMEEAIVVLWTDRGQMLAATETNEHGEFQFDFEPQEQLRLSVAMSGRKTMRVPLENLS